MMGTAKDGRIERLLIFALLLEFLALIALQILAIPFHTSRNYNEGWNAYFSQAALHGGVLYPTIDSMAENNYPPLSFYIVGAIGWIVGDNIVGGRLIEVISLCVIAGNVFKLGRWLGAERQLASLAAGVFLLGTYALMPDYIAIDDPHFLAYAFATTAALLFLKAEGPNLWVNTLLSAALVVLAGFIKHSVVSIPLTLCIWAAIYNRRQLRAFLISGFVVGLLACTVAYLGWGQAMVHSVLFSHRQLWLKRSALLMLRDLPFLVPYVVMTILGWLMLRTRHKAAFVLIYVACSIFNGFWMLSGAGVNQNVMLDAVIALSLGSTAFVMGVADLSKQRGWAQHRARLLATLFVAIPCAVTGFYVYLSNPSVRDVAAIVDVPQWEKLSGTLSLSHGDVACETLAVCYWAHKPLEIDFFNYGQKLFTGSVYANARSGFFDKVTRKSYAYIVIEKDSIESHRLPQFLMEALFENYKPVQLFAKNQLLLVPRSR
jgi:hypothetical protein